MRKLTLLEKMRSFITNREFASSNTFFLEFIGMHINKVRYNFMIVDINGGLANRVCLEKCGIELTFDENGFCNGIDYGMTLISPMNILKPLALLEAKFINKKIKIYRFGGMRGVTYWLEVCEGEGKPIVEYTSTSSLRNTTKKKIWNI